MYPTRRPCRVKFWRPRHIQELFQDRHNCKPVEGMAQIDPKLDIILKRCTAGAPWTSVPIGTDRSDVAEAHKVGGVNSVDAAMVGIHTWYGSAGTIQGGRYYGSLCRN